MRMRFVSVTVALAAGIAGCGQIVNPGISAQGSALSAASTGIESQSVQDALKSLDVDGVTSHPLPEPGTTGDGFDTPPAGALQAEQSTDSAISAKGLWPTPPPGDLANFGILNDHLFRGARPTDQGFADLKNKGVNLVIDLENGKQEIAWEKQEVESHGMKFMSLAMGVILPPSMAQVNTFLETVEGSNHPTVYFHCMQGRDRTGVMAFCYRVKHDGWNTQQAYTEMKYYQFHTYLLGLNAFVHWYGDTYGPKS